VRDTQVRFAQKSDRDQLARLRAMRWPESSAGEHGQELRLILGGQFPGVMPPMILVAQAGDGTLAGFLEAGLRWYADGCEARYLVGHVDGWYVAENWRQQGIGTELLRAAEDWARSQGCIEMASDTAIHNQVSQRVHQALGFEIVERSVRLQTCTGGRFLVQGVPEIKLIADLRPAMVRTGQRRSAAPAGHV